MTRGPAYAPRHRDRDRVWPLSGNAADRHGRIAFHPLSAQPNAVDPGGSIVGELPTPGEQTGEMQPPHRLILLRHAKSSWKDASLPDDERPLAPRGRRALVLVAQHLQTAAADVDLVLSSPARRTRQTWDGLRAGLRAAPEVCFVPEIYEATGSELLEALKQVDRRNKAVLLVGHNPGIQELACGLVSGGDDAALSRLRQGFPTAALAIFSSDLDWADLRWRGACLESFTRPRDLSPG